MLTDQSAPHALLNPIPPLLRGNHRNAGTRQVPGRPPLQLLRPGRRVVLGLLLLGIGTAGTHVPGPATGRPPPRMTSMNCDSMQHTLHLSHALARVSHAQDQSRYPDSSPTAVPLATLLHSTFTHLSTPPPPCISPLTPQVCSALLVLAPRGSLPQSALVCTVSTCQHLSELQGELKQTLVP